MDRRSNPVPAEDQDAPKARFQGEGEDAFGGKCASEDVADVFRIYGPVSPEFKFHNNAGGHAEPEDEGEDADPEPDGHFETPVFRFDVQPFEDDEDKAHADAQRRVDVMEANGEGELNAGQNLDIHGDEVISSYIPGRCCRPLRT